MARLHPKDLELTLTGKTVDLSEPKNAFLGGEFLTNSKDYIEVLIYDVNNNFLESAIVNEEDYLYDQDTGIKLKTGTILRKMGYDRGRFVVKYNFLRKVAGSYENVLVDSTGVIQDGEYDPETMRIKEYKYFIHEISPSRQEVRLAAQNISDEQYLRDFYYAQKTKKTVQADGTGDSAIIFEGEAHGQPVQEDSLAMRFLAPDNVFLQEMVGGTIVFPDVFIKSFTEVPQPYTGEGIVPEVEIEGTPIQARFFVDRDASYTEIVNANGSLGDKTFALALEKFANGGVGYDDETLPASLTGIDFEGTNKMSNIRNLKDSNFNCMYYEWGGGTDSYVVLRSNSTLPNVETPTNYLWEITGWDKDNNPTRWNPITPRTGASGGDFTIETSSDTTVATTAGLSNTFQAQTVDGQDGSTFIFTMHSKNLHIGIKLTVSQPFGDGSAESTLWLPAIIENQPD